jgi:hypothetical protein
MRNRIKPRISWYSGERKLPLSIIEQIGQKKLKGSKMGYHNIGEESTKLCMATVGVSPDGTVFPVRCKQWSCEICAPINALHCAIRTVNGVRAIYAAGWRVKFATITQPGSVKTPEFAYRILANQWSKFRQKWEYWVDKQEGYNLYAAFVEGQGRRAGMPHFHILATSLPTQDKLKDWVVSSGLGYMVDLQDIEPNSGVAWYVSKYSTKGSDAHLMPKGFRRVRFSRDWPQMLFRADMLESKAIVRLPHETYAAWLLRAVQSFGVDPSDVMAKVVELCDKTQGEEQADYAARTLMVLEQW